MAPWSIERPGVARHSRGLHLTAVRRRVVSPTDPTRNKPVSNETSKEMTAEAYLARLGDRGIDYVFANAGTDFAPIVEAISRHRGNGARYTRFITVPHDDGGT